MNDLNEGYILDSRYEIHEKIGEGGMSVVYRATDTYTSDIVAVKILKQEFSYDEEFIKRFKNEAMAVQELSHPNIVSIYEMGSDEDVHYLIMEHIDGISLDELIKAKKKLPWRNALNISAQILSAVDHAHSHKIIHRDIKPLNVMITVDGVVKLTDFGIARAVSSATKSASNDSAGSVHYLSPEQVRGGFVDERSDVYSIGITMYEMVTGKVPYDGDSHVTIALRHLDGDMCPPNEVDPTIPHGVSDLIVLATRKETNKRFQSAGEMYEMLMKVMRNPYISFLNENSGSANEINIEYDDSDYDTNLKEDSEGVVEFEEETEKNAKIRNILVKSITYAIAALVSVAVIIFAYSMHSSIKESLKADVVYNAGNYVGMPSDDVIQSLEEQGFVIESVLETNTEYPVGYITKQSVEPNTEIEKGDTIVLSVAAEEGSFIMNNYEGEDYKYVAAELELQGLIVVEKELNSVKYADRQVIRTSPGTGSIISKGDTVTIYRSTGAVDYYTTLVPNLKGMTIDEARNALAKNGLKLDMVYPQPYSTIEGIIFTYTPSPTATPSAFPIIGVNVQAQPEAMQMNFNAQPLDFMQLELGAIDNNIATNDGNIPTPTVTASTEMPTTTPSDFSTYTQTFESITQPTLMPTQTPIVTMEPTPTPTPHVYSSARVVYQYPAAGTTVTSGESVILYFYEDILSVLPRKEVYFDYPNYDKAPVNSNNQNATEGLNIDPIEGDSCSVIVKAYVGGIEGDYFEEIIYQIDEIKKNRFPIRLSVPVSLNGEPTKVYVYLGDVGGTTELIEMINVYE